MDSKIIEKIFVRFFEKEPSPKSELYYTNIFTLIIAVLLSAQSTDKQVNKITKVLFKLADTPEKMLKLGVIELKSYIRSIGLYINKANNIIALSEKLLTSPYPINQLDFDYLITLPGIGRKSANVILNIAFKQPLIGVDTHVHRVSNRIGLLSTKNALQTEKILNVIIPDCWKEYINHWLVIHGRYTCTARSPKCFKCFIVDLCEYKCKNLLSDVPK